jgi:hypothetical protein
VNGYLLMAMLSVAMLAGCEGCNDGTNIHECATACGKSGRAMDKYSSRDGCICSAPAPQGSK